MKHQRQLFLASLALLEGMHAASLRDWPAILLSVMKISAIQQETSPGSPEKEMRFLMCLLDLLGVVWAFTQSDLAGQGLAVLSLLVGAVDLILQRRA